jgi:chitinase
MRIRFLYVLIALSSLGASLSIAADKLSVGYYPDWNKGILPPSAIPYRSLTHILHSFMIPAADGNVSGLSAYGTLVQTAHLNNVKVLVSLGGWDQSAGFSPMTADTAARHRFVNTMTNFCVNNAYDGVDIDWEYPKNTTDRTNFRLLVHELRQSFDTLIPRRLISIAAPATSWSGQWFDVEGMIADLDWIGMMTYDFYGSWTTKAGPNSALYGSFSTNTEGWVDYSTSYYLGRSVPPSKLLIGTPLYGWIFSASSLYGASTGASQAAYSSIISRLDQGWTRYWDDQGRVPYMINPAATQLISYDDSTSVALKCSYINTKGLGGTIIWALGQDKLADRQPIMEVIGAGLLPTTSVAGPAPTTEIPSGFEISQNYPNPFNGQTRVRYSIPEPGLVRLAVCDVLGRELVVIVNDNQPAGEHEVRLMAESLPSGVYFLRLAWHSHVATRACVVIR